MHFTSFSAIVLVAILSHGAIGVPIEDAGADLHRRTTTARTSNTRTSLSSTTARTSVSTSTTATGTSTARGGSASGSSTSVRGSGSTSGSSTATGTTTSSTASSTAGGSCPVKQSNSRPTKRSRLFGRAGTMACGVEIRDASNSDCNGRYPIFGYKNGKFLKQASSGSGYISSRSLANVTESDLDIRASSDGDVEMNENTSSSDPASDEEMQDGTNSGNENSQNQNSQNENSQSDGEKSGSQGENSGSGSYQPGSGSSDHGSDQSEYDDARLQCDHVVELQLLAHALDAGGVCDALDELVAISGGDKATYMDAIIKEVNKKADLFFLDKDLNGEKKSIVGRVKGLAGGGLFPWDADKLLAWTAVNKYLNDATVNRAAEGTAQKLDTLAKAMIDKAEQDALNCAPTQATNIKTAAGKAKHTPSVESLWDKLIDFAKRQAAVKP